MQFVTCRMQQAHRPARPARQGRARRARHQVTRAFQMASKGAALTTDALNVAGNRPRHSGDPSPLTKGVTTGVTTGAVVLTHVLSRILRSGFSLKPNTNVSPDVDNKGLTFTVHGTKWNREDQFTIGFWKDRGQLKSEITDYPDRYEYEQFRGVANTVVKYVGNQLYLQRGLWPLPMRINCKKHRGHGHSAKDIHDMIYKLSSRILLPECTIEFI